jgi:autotransporter passenger strand-loop-strand repeat protein
MSSVPLLPTVVPLTAISTTVTVGGLEFVLSGGLASGTVVGNGGVAVVESGGIGRSAVDDGAARGPAAVDNFEASNTGTTVNSGGAEYVYSGATESGTTVTAGAGKRDFRVSALRSIVRGPDPPANAGEE